MAGWKDDGGPAFPCVETNEYGHPMQLFGMSRREWFAGQALAGLAARHVDASSDRGAESAKRISAQAYEIADAKRLWGVS